MRARSFDGKKNRKQRESRRRIVVVLMVLGMLSLWSFDCTLLVKFFHAVLARPSFFAGIQRGIEELGRNEIIVSLRDDRSKRVLDKRGFGCKDR